jgi:F0F1-type ATP synthase assembly protein I
MGMIEVIVIAIFVVLAVLIVVYLYLRAKKKESSDEALEREIKERQKETEEEIWQETQRGHGLTATQKAFLASMLIIGGMVGILAGIYINEATDQVLSGWLSIGLGILALIFGLVIAFRK